MYMCVYMCAAKSSLRLKLLRLKIHRPIRIFFSSAPLLFILIGRVFASSRIRDRLRSYCFWIPRLPWERPIGTISCKYQSYFGGGRDYYFFLFSFRRFIALFHIFLDLVCVCVCFCCCFSFSSRVLSQCVQYSISICVIGKVKVHLISHPSLKRRDSRRTRFLTLFFRKKVTSFAK